MHGAGRHARQGFDRLAQAVKVKLGEDPQNGSLFVFSNRGATRLKALWFDRNGYCVLYKRLRTPWKGGKWNVNS